MPEGDRFEMMFGAGWRAAYKWAREGVAPAEIADKCLSVLARTLREGGGVPRFNEIEEIIQHATTGTGLHTNGAIEDAESLLDAFSKLDRIVQNEGGHEHTKVAVESAKSLIFQQRNYDRESFWTEKLEFAEKTCKDLVEHFYFATARQNLVAQGKLENHETARQWQHNVEESMQPGVRQMAERLMKDSSAKDIRAPNRTVKPHPTKDLLEEVLVTSETLSGGQDRRGR